MLDPEVQRGRPCRMSEWGGGGAERHVGLEQPPAEGQVQVKFGMGDDCACVWDVWVRDEGGTGESECASRVGRGAVRGE